MTVAALVAGFAVSLAMEVSQDDIETYARWELETFLGPHSAVCEKMVPWGIAKDQACDENACTHAYASYANGWGVDSCDKSSGACSPLVRNSIDMCSAQATDYLDELIAFKTARVDREIGGGCMSIVWCRF